MVDTGDFQHRYTNFRHTNLGMPKFEQSKLVRFSVDMSKSIEKIQSKLYIYVKTMLPLFFSYANILYRANFLMIDFKSLN